MKKWHWWLFDYLLRKIIVQGYQDNIELMYKKIYDRHSVEFNEDNIPTLVCYMFYCMLRMTDRVTHGGNYLEQAIHSEIKEYYEEKYEKRKVGRNN